MGEVDLQHSHRPVWPKRRGSWRRTRLQQVVGFADYRAGHGPGRRIICQQRLDFGTHLGVDLVLFEVTDASLRRKLDQFAK